ncbi:hypothetical protein E8K88_08010 [Lampropedia aestuarii]|uniref:Phage tail collar domain-containing protein n=1 Tax=Lampropedia aestuarii TaxID=2562762 RepID=A0A4S5BVT7_9BURK|nr:tail fiber protein [Lampropedia aestuarii]THJ34026.1 hypothetical protein E8K88_08010 [Lampropedia aestuarii]
MKFHTVRKTALATFGSLGLLFGGQAMAQAEMYLGQLFLMGSNFCPSGSVPANGAALSVASNSALYSLLGTQFGGDGQHTFKLPDLRGRSPIGAGQGASSSYYVGEYGGSEHASLTHSNLPSHTHQINSLATAAASTKAATHSTPAPDRVPAQTMNAGGYIAADQADTELGGIATTSTASVVGSQQPFSIRDPYLVMTWCIVTNGIYPSRP